MTRQEYIDAFVAERRAAWIRGNTSYSPSGANKPGEPSAQHLATWADMAASSAPVYPPAAAPKGK